MPEVIARQSAKLMDHMGGDFVNLRMFRTYLIDQGLTTLSDVQGLAKNTEMVIFYCGKLQPKGMQGRQLQ